ncbi:MAG: ABC transporter substrate-binding protein [Gammaproteobacteria bacterium]
MAGSLKRIVLSLFLIVLAAAILLWSDRHNRHSRTVAQVPQNAPVALAILQHSSNPIMDEVRDGLLQGLKNKGFSDGQNLAVTVYNAEGDLPTGNLMAQKITSGDFKLAASISTVMLQALANANREGKVIHVFGAVTSPVAAGVGIKTIGSLDKPPYLTGIGTPQPVTEIFRLAKHINPDLKTVGVVWNPAEVNSEVCTKQARQVAAELDITLLEAPIEQGKDVREAANSLAARGVEAFWTGGDASVNAVVDTLIEAARAAKVPVFSNIAGHARRGALFDDGANYFEVGVKEGEIAGAILAGADPAQIPVEDFVPQRIFLNEQVSRQFGERWRFDAALRERADVIIEADGKETVRQVAAKAQLVPGKHYKVGVAYFAPEPGIDSVMAGLREGLKALGLEEGRNLTFRSLHAQAEIAQIPAIGQVLDNSDVDAILALTTPVLQGVGMTAKHKPVVFTYVSDPLAAGAGKSFTDHLPNLTGIGSFPPIEDQLAAARSVLPKLHTVGTLYNPSEANSVKVAQVLRELCKKAGLVLQEAPVNTPAEVVQSAQALVARRVEAILSVGDNTMYQALDAIAKIAKDAEIPLILDQSDFIDHDALMVIGADYKESGRAAAEPLVQVLSGVDPATIPLRNVSKKTVLLNEASAKRLGIVFPPELRAAAQASSAAAPPPLPPKALDHPWKIKRLMYVESLPAEDAVRGIDDGFKAAGLVAGRDFILSEASAQGDMITLSTLADAVNSDGTELLMTLSTPTLQTVLHKVTEIPIVFTFVADPLVAGAGSSEKRFSPLITGVYTQAPSGTMVDMLAHYFPQFRKVGTLFTPVEDNSVHNKDLFVQEAARRGISVETLPVNSPGELPDAALAMASRPVDAWVQTLDNQVVAGFSVIAQAAARAKKPLFSFTETAVEQGAIAAYTMDYHQAGFDAALKAAQVMRGTPPAEIPFSAPSQMRLIVSAKNAKAVGLTLPAELLQKADKRIGE